MVILHSFVYVYQRVICLPRPSVWTGVSPILFYYVYQYVNICELASYIWGLRRVFMRAWVRPWKSKFPLNMDDFQGRTNNNFVKSIDGPFSIANVFNSHNGPFLGDLPYSIFIIWLWINTYKFHSFWGMKHDFYPSYFGVHQRGTGFWPISISIDDHYPYKVMPHSTLSWFIIWWILCSMVDISIVTIIKPYYN